MSNRTDVAIPKTLVDYIGYVDEGIQLLEHSYALEQKALSKLGKVGHYVNPGVGWGYNKPAEAKKNIYAGAWRAAIRQTGLTRYMDEQALNAFEKSLERNPPPFDLANIRLNLLEFAQKADEMFARGVVNIFHGLSCEYVRHRKSPFEVPKKIILNGACQEGYRGAMQVGYVWGARFSDIDRVFKVLDEEEFEPSQLRWSLDAAWKEGWPYEDDYYWAKPYKNGNVHITFKREDLLVKVNTQIANYYEGKALAQAA